MLYALLSSVFLHFKLVLFFSLRRTSASFAGPSAMVPTRVLGSVFVSMNTLRLFGFFSHKTMAPINVNFLCNGFEMIRVYTCLISAKMIEHEPFWHKAIVKFVRKFVSPYSFIQKTKGSVSFTDGSSPNPTKFSFINFFPKSFHAKSASMQITRGQ